MADNPGIESVEKLLSNIMGHTVKVANMLSQIKAASDSFDPQHSAKIIADFFRQHKIGNQSFRNEKGQMLSYDRVSSDLVSALVKANKALNNFTQSVSSTTKHYKRTFYDKQSAINSAYALSRNKYAVSTPFSRGRSQLAYVTDWLTVGTGNQLRNAVLDPSFDMKKLGRISGLKGFQKAGLFLRRGLSGAAAGGGLPGLAIATLLGAGMWGLSKWTDAFKTSLSAGSLSMGMAARGAGAGWGQSDITGAIFRGRLMGASSEEARNALVQGQMAGLTLEQSMSALSATKALGISNAVAKTQTVARRILGQDPNDPAKFFSSLKPVAEKTRLSLEELTNAAQEAAGAFRGQLDANALRGVLGKFGDLVRTGEFSWGEIFSTAGTMQRLSPNQQIAAAHFAAVGGYQFRNTDALGRAYELQRMGGKDIGEQTKALRDAIRGVLISSRGSDRWDLLTDAQKYTYGNYVLSSMGLTDFYKQPGGELLMEKIMTNGLFTDKDITAWENATTSSTEKIAQKMEAIINPLNYINTYVAALAVNAGAGKVGEWAQKAIDEFVDKQTHLDVRIFNKFGSNVGVELGLNRSAGMPVPIKVDPQAGGN